MQHYIKKTLKNTKKKNKYEDNIVATASFFIDERENNKDFGKKFNIASLYRQLRDNDFEDAYVKNVPAYAAVFKDDFNKFMQKNNITDKNIGLAKFYWDELEKYRGPAFSERISKAEIYRELNEDKEKTNTPHLPHFCACRRCGNVLVRNGKFTDKVKVIKDTTVECGVCHLNVNVAANEHEL